MRLTFTKMHGLGNDFVVIDAIGQSVELTPERVRFLADRHRGVGCDQVLVVERPQAAGVDFRYRIFNADGGEVEQCGNGARCFARFVRDRGFTTRDRIAVETRAGVIHPELRPDGQVTVDMGVPVLEPAAIPFEAPARAVSYTLDAGTGPCTIGAVSMGNPHALLEVAAVAEAPVARLGALIERHPRFPRRTNVGFIEFAGRDTLRLRTWERGAGETQACGTNACAAVVWARLLGRVEERVAVHVPGGTLVLSWPGPGAPVLMTGPATAVFEGVIEL